LGAEASFVPNTLIQVVLPEMGESVTEGSITGWRKAVGDRVEAGEPLVDVTTDKVDVEVPAPASGKLARILAADGATVPVGTPLAEIDTSATENPDVAVALARPGASPQTTTIVMPSMGESVAEGIVGEWRKREGDIVKADDTLVEITTDKVNVEVPAGVDGHVARILAKEGDTVAVGAPLAEIDTAHSAESAPVAQARPLQPDTQVAPVAQTRPLQPDTEAAPVAQARPLQPDVQASPLAKRLAYTKGINLDGARGTGPGGVIRRDDVLAAGKGQPPAPLPPDAVATPLKGPAASLASYMEQSLSIPTATSFRAMAVDVLDARRRELNAALKSANRPEKISFTHLIAFAIVQAVKDVPSMATSFRRGEKGPERVARGVHLGLAVDMQRKDGTRFLIVPVIHSADALDFKSFHASYETSVAKARTNTLTPDDVAGATLTLTNPGGIGTVASVPRLMPGQGTIVAAGAIGYPPGLGSAPEATLKSIGVAKVMTLTSTYDHRVIQGAESGEFLRRIEQLLAGASEFYESIFRDLDLRTPVALATAPPPADARPATTSVADLDLMRAAAAGAALVSRYRTHGHVIARLDPLDVRHPVDPALDPATLGLTPELMKAVPAAALRVYSPGNNLMEVLERFRAIYCATIAYEVEHITNHERRSWLRKQIESGSHLAPVSKERRLRLLDRLTRVEAFERYLRKAFLGHKTFSIEGVDAMVPMMEEMLDIFAEDGVGEVDIGMAHRGRLSVITHVVDRPYEEVLREFEQAEARGVQGEGDVTGDVKYHQGATGSYRTADGKQIGVVLANNPSHLEAVDGVVEGRTRAAQSDRSHNIATLDARRAVAVLVHGDAAFSAQGTVAETLNLSALAGYTTGGTIHLIANNQIGFTTTPEEGRSTRYASDLAKGFDLPIIHVNADDVEACIGGIRLAVSFREQFGRDAVIDLVGYRRFGHNEADEPAYTQPQMYETIAKHPTVREIFAKKLVEEGVTTEADVKQRFDAATERVAQAHKNAKAEVKAARGKTAAKRAPNGAPSIEPDTRVAQGSLAKLNDELLAVPPDFTVHPKLARQLEKRRTALTSDGEIDWALGEALAFASLIVGGKPVRMTGQDTERGTFSHRHLVLHDAKDGKTWMPMQHLSGAQASFELYNSPLSEYACVAFEYGYSAAAADSLILWEAQFGDFANGAQIIIDQFISGGFAKWGATSRLTLLLPHGYEGAGPEHSSARLERFLQLAAEGNFRVAYPSTPAQYFHLLRDQALSQRARPLVMMTPKSLLRLKAASSRIADLTERGFATVIDDPSVADRAKIERLVLCTGKVYYDLIASPARAKATGLAIARVELLEPFPLDDVLALVGKYPNLRRVTWVQEEPRNMGARAFVSRRIREPLTQKGIAFDYIGRPDRASPSEGYPGAHAAEQERIITTALSAPALEEAR
jgi:2-oxoglutarate dehydrogenase E1 component